MNMQWLSPLTDFTRVPEVSEEENPVYVQSASSVTVEAKSIKIHERDYDRAFDIYEWRFLTEYPVTKVYHAHLERETREGV